MSNLITILADAGPLAGSGHVVRMLTLASALRDRWREIALLTNGLPNVLASCASDNGLSVLDLQSPISSMDVVAEVIAMQPSVVIIDSYSISTNAIGEIAEKVPVVLVDDNGEHAEATATVLLNQNLHAEKIDYREGFSRSIRMLGPQYALLRDDIVSRRGSPRRIRPQSVLVSLGGADPLGLGQPIVEALQDLPGIEVIYAHGHSGESPFTLERMAEALATATAAVIACGTTTWEAATLGLPFIGVVTTDNQYMVGDSLAENALAPVVDARGKNVDGRIINELARHVTELLYDNERRRNAARMLMEMVDGRGATRVADVISSLMT